MARPRLAVVLCAAFVMAMPSTALAQSEYLPFTYRSGGTSVRDVAVADVNGDGWRDVVCLITSSARHLEIFLNGPSGLQSTATTVPINTLNALGLALADMDHDGDIDAVVTGFGVLVFSGNGTGGFGEGIPYSASSSMRDVALTDLDGDGWTDAVLANGLTHSAGVMLGDGSGGLEPKTDYTGSTAPYYIAAGDLTGDGIPDAAMSCAVTGGIAFFRGLGDGSFATRQLFFVGERPEKVALGDLNGDGWIDAVVGMEGAETGTPTQELGVLLNATDQGTSRFLPVQTYVSGPRPRHVALADADGDGDLDILAANEDATLSLLRNAGDGTFGSPVVFPITLTSRPTAIEIADLNRDGLDDVIIGHSNGPTISVFYHAPRAGLPEATDVGAVAFAVGSANPGGGPVRLSIRLAQSERVRLNVHDAQGRRVRSLFHGVLPAGERTVTWDGADEAGVAVASGLYFCSLATDETAITRRVVRTR